MQGKEVFVLNKSNFSETVKQLHEKLTQTKATKKEIFRAELLVEETFMRMTEIGKTETVEIRISKRFGDLSLRMESSGEEYNPLVEVTDYDEEDDDYYRTLILKANRSKMSYTRKNGKNIVIIRVKDADNKQIYYTLIGMVGGIICGAVMKEMLTPDLITMFDKTIIGSIRTMFLNALNMMIAPVVFFSVISGITSITNASDVGRIGGKLIGLYGLTTLIAASLSLVIGYVVFLGDVPQFGTIDSSAADSTFQSQSITPLTILVGLIPKNLIDPIVKGEMLQIIFVAIVFGICINKLGDKVKILNEFIEAMNTFALKMIIMIVEFIPLIAFISMASLMLNVGSESMFMLGRMILGQLIGSLIMLAVYAVLMIVIGKISPVPFFKKLPSFIAIPMSTSSSNVTMPFTMKFCTEKLGISPRLSSFSIPIGATVNMDGGCFYLTTAAIMMAKMYGIEINFDILMTILVTVVALSVGAPGVSGAAFVVLATTCVALGIPIEAATVVLGIDPICALMRVTVNVVGDIADTAILACRENLIDKEVYFKNL